MAGPACGEHPRSKVVRAGLYGPREHRRQLWWCYPDGTPASEGKHRFAETMPRTLRAAGEPDFCPSCTTHLEAYEGPVHARSYEFPANVIAAALVAVGQGTSYQLAAKTARVSNGWRRRRQTRPARFGANGTLVQDWVGLYGPLVTADLRTTPWPDVIALDELPFTGTRKRREAHARKGRTKDAARWAILGAYAWPEYSPTDSRRGRLFALHAVPTLNRANAAAFLASIPGRPRYVIADGGGLWPNAIADAWPQIVDPDTGEVLAETPRLLPCQWHLAQKLREDLRRSAILPPRDAEELIRRRRYNGYQRIPRVRAMPARPMPEKVDENHPVAVAAHTALRSVADWDAFVELAERYQVHPLAGYYRPGTRDGDYIRGQLQTWPPGVARTIGGLEAQLAQVRAELRHRSNSFSNARRTNALLALVVLARQGRGDPQRYTQIIHDHVVRKGGHAPPLKVGVTGGPRLQNA